MPVRYPYKIGDEPVSGYRLVRFLGKGNFGEVWQAAAPGGATVALKVIPDLSGKQAHKEFRALGITKNLHHPNLVSINAIWLKDGDGQILDDSMAAKDKLPEGFLRNNDPLQATLEVSSSANPELCELVISMGLGNKNLHDRLVECQAAGMQGIPIEELLDYMEESAKAIDYLNAGSREGETKRAGVQHCDIKPHNILIVGSAAQVCDFGLARAQGEVRATSTVAASVAYAAPECLENTGDPSPATDQYSLAISYYELRTGELPYHCETVYQVMQASLSGDLDLSLVSADEQTVLRRATARNPADRYPSAVSMVKSLRRAVEGRLDIGFQTTQYMPPKRRRAPLVIGAALVALVAGLGAWVFRDQVGALRDPPTSPAPVRNELDDLIAKAEELTSRDKVTAAIDYYDNRIIPLDPKSPKVYFGRALAYQKANDFDRAIADFEKARQLDKDRNSDKQFGVANRPQPPAAYLARAKKHREADEIDAAIKDCNTVIERYSGSAGAAYSERGACYREQGDLKKALSDLGQAIELSKNDALAYGRRGGVYLTLGKLDEALRDLDAAIQIKPDYFDLFNRGVVLSAKNEPTKAIAEFNKLLEEEPEDKDVRYQRGLAYIDLPNHSAAIADFRAVVELDPTNADARAYLALLLAGQPNATQEEVDEALRHAKEACRISDRKNAAHLDALAAAYARNQDFANAATIAQMAVDVPGLSDEEKENYKSHLELYKDGKPLTLQSAAAP